MQQHVGVFFKESSWNGYLHGQTIRTGGRWAFCQKSRFADSIMVSVSILWCLSVSTAAENLQVLQSSVWRLDSCSAPRRSWSFRTDQETSDVGWLTGSLGWTQHGCWGRSGLAGIDVLVLGRDLCR